MHDQTDTWSGHISHKKKRSIFKTRYKIRTSRLLQGKMYNETSSECNINKATVAYEKSFYPKRFASKYCEDVKYIFNFLYPQ